MRREFDASGPSFFGPSFFGPSFFGPSFFGRAYFGGNRMSLASLLTAAQTARAEQRDAQAALIAAKTRQSDADESVRVNDAAFAAALAAVGGRAIDRRGASPVLYAVSDNSYTVATLPAIEDELAANPGDWPSTIQGGVGGDTLQGGAGNDVVLVD